jgi:uncharacterized protein involved in response to NO
MAAIPRLRPYNGPAILSYGFRPFFLLGALYSGTIVLIWLPALFGEISIPTALAPRDWHFHEMLYGYVSAVITGFLLTAIPNWTGRLPIQGMPLLVLIAVWLAGRAAVSFSGPTGWWPAAIIDAAFLVLVAAAAAREIVAGRNWRNLRVVALVSLLALANVSFHLEAHFAGSAEYSIRLGISLVVLLLSLIGGRITPSFTHNWLVRENPGRLPVPFDRFDVLVVIASAFALTLWTCIPESYLTTALLTLAAIMQTIRLLRWAGIRTYYEPLVLILHAGYGFVPLGFAFAALASAGAVLVTTGIHAWTVGAFGTMTLAVMTRATLGHTGRTLTASAATRLIYAAVLIAAMTRIWAALQPSWMLLLLHIAALAWAGAFLGFAIVYGPMLCRAHLREAHVG